MPTRNATPRLHIRLLGAPDVLVDGQPLHVDTRKAVAILALLAADGRPYARDELAALLWPESDEGAAHGALRRTLSVMRAAIDGDALRIERTRVQLDPTLVRVDLTEMERLAAGGSRAGLAAAADLARGPFLAGFNLRDSPAFDDWRAARAVAVERSVLRVLDGLAALAEADGDLLGAIDAAARRLDLDPLDEGAHVRLIELYGAIGDPAAAVRQYRACVGILERELGVAPLATTTARYEAIRDTPPVRNPVRVQPSPVELTGPQATIDPGGDPGPPLVGQESVSATIDAVIAATVRDGQGRVIALTGEAGIGKTRLGEAVALRVRSEGGTVLAARGHPGEAAIAYGAVVDLLRAAGRDAAATAAIEILGPSVRTELGRLVPALDPGRRGPAHRAMADATAHARLVGAIADGLIAVTSGPGPGPGLLWIDDVHWVDGASLEAVAVLTRRLADRRLLVVLAWREEDVPGATAPAIDVLKGMATAHIPLERLAPDAALALIGEIGPDDLPVADRIGLSEAAEGLPLYIVAALAAGSAGTTGSLAAGPVPAGVRTVLRTRLASLDEMAAQVLAAAAIIGRTFDVATLRHASGRTEEATVDALDRLAARAFVREGPAGYDFAHGVLRDLVDEDIGLARRRLLHQRIAEALRLDVGGLGRDDLGRHTGIAIHEREAGRAAAAADAYRTAADRAAAVFAHPATVDLAEAALALGHPDAVDLHTLIGRARTYLGDYAGAVAAFESAAAWATPVGLPGIEWEIGRARLRRGDLAGADQHLATAAADPAASPTVVARAWVDRSVIRRRGGDIAGATSAAEEALAVADAAGDDAAVGAARRMLGLCALDAGDTALATTQLRAAVDASRADPDPSSRIAALVGLALATGAAGDVETALGYGTTARDECRRIGDRHLEAAVEDHLADLLHAVGRDDEARDHQRRAVEAFTEVGGARADPDPGIWMLAAW